MSGYVTTKEERPALKDVKKLATPLVIKMIRRRVELQQIAAEIKAEAEILNEQLYVAFKKKDVKSVEFEGAIITRRDAGKPSMRLNKTLLLEYIDADDLMKCYKGSKPPKPGMKITLPGEEEGDDE